MLKQSRPQQPESYLSVSQAARQFSVHPSTIRRWIDQGRLPAYRLGQKRVGIRVSDLERVVAPRPVGGRQAVPGAQVRVEGLTPDEQKRGLKLLDELARLREEDLVRRDGKPYSPSWHLLDKARKERLHALNDEP